MSLAARIALVGSPNLITTQQQRDDLLNPDVTQTGLIALLADLCVTKGHIFKCTAVKSDHGNDSDLGEHCHWNGYCADGWPMCSTAPNDYMSPLDSRFAQFCHDAGFDPYEHQVGLAGSAYTHADVTAAGAGVFHDGGADHIHLGARTV